METSDSCWGDTGGLHPLRVCADPLDPSLAFTERGRSRPLWGGLPWACGFPGAETASGCHLLAVLLRQVIEHPERLRLLICKMGMRSCLQGVMGIRPCLHAAHQDMCGQG